MEAEVEFSTEIRISHVDQRGFDLRVVDAPMTASLRTWAMDLAQEDLPLPLPAFPGPAKGFWNDIPDEEQRELMPVMPPSYVRLKPEQDIPSIDLMEMAGVVIGIYLILAIIHLSFIIAHL